MLRVAAFEQKEVVEVLNKHFVCIEFDATNGIPEDVPGMWLLRRAWETIPWTRVSFGYSLVMDPEGKYLLSGGYGGRKAGPYHPGPFRKTLEESLQRHREIRQHERGSDTEKQAIAALDSQIRKELQEERGALFDLRVRTRGVFNADLRFETRFSNMFTYPDPVVRRQTAEAIGNYLKLDVRPNFFVSGTSDYILEQLTKFESDEDESVRKAATEALVQFQVATKKFETMDITKGDANNLGWTEQIQELDTNNDGWFSPEERAAAKKRAQGDS